MALIRDAQSDGTVNYSHPASITSKSKAFSTNPASGDWILVCVSSYNLLDPPGPRLPATHSAPTDSLSTSFTQIGTTITEGTDYQGISMWLGQCPSGGADTVTAHTSGTHTLGLSIWLLDGATLAGTPGSPYNNDVASATGAASSFSVGPTSCNSLNSLHIGGAATPVAGAAATTGSGWNTTGQNGYDSSTMHPGSTAGGIVSEYKVSTANQSPNFTQVAGYSYCAIAASFLIEDAPVVTSCTPASGSTVGSESTTIAGQFFKTGATVTIGGNAATSVVVVSSTSITCVTPAHLQPGAVNVVVTNANGQSGTGTGIYTYALPIVTSCTPADEATTGGAVTITGQYFHTGATVTFGGSAATGVTVVSFTSITCTTPAHNAGLVTVVVTNTDLNTGSGDVYTYHKPTVDSLSVTSSTVKGTVALTITGTYFRASAIVKFTVTSTQGAGELVSPNDTVVVSDTSITCTVPAHPNILNGVNPYELNISTAVTVTNADGGHGGTNVTAPTFTYLHPVVTLVEGTITPTTPLANSGPVSGLVPVTITGTYFDSTTTVVRFTTQSFPGIHINASSVVVVNSTTITCVVPPAPLALQGGFATCTIPESESCTVLVGDSWLIAGEVANAYFYRLPVVTSFTPNDGPVGGTPTVTIGGTYFETGEMGTPPVAMNMPGLGLVLCSFVTVVDPVTLTAVIPTYGGVGPLPDAITCYVLASADGCSHGAYGGTFTYHAPEPLSCTPNTGVVAGTQTVTISGTYFTDTTQVVFDGAYLATSVQVVNDTTVTCITPAHIPGPVPIRLAITYTRPDAVVSTNLITGTLVSGFIYHAPTPTSCTPDHSGVLGVQNVTIAGSYFTGATAGYVDTIYPLTNFAVINDTTILGTFPIHDPGLVNVNVSTVTVPPSYVVNVTGTLADGFTYHAPEPVSCTPSAGGVAGGQFVTIAGYYFTGTTEVAVDTDYLLTGVTVIDAFTITGTLPAHSPGVVNISVSIVTVPPSFLIDVTGVLVNGFTYHAPDITSVSPANGILTGGLAATLTGHYFTGVSIVAFDQYLATNVSVISDTAIAATTPTHAPGLVPVSVEVTGIPVVGNVMGTKSDAFTYHHPEPASCTPARGTSLGGTPVTLVGQYFTGMTRVSFDLHPASAVVVVNDTVATCTTPAHHVGAVDIQAYSNALGGVYYGTLVKGYFYMARGWWYSTNDFDGGVTTIDPTQGELPGAPRDWAELAFATGTANYLGGWPDCAAVFNNRLIYAKGNYTVNVDAPAIRSFDGAADRELCQIPSTSAGVVSKAILAMLTAHDTVYFSTFDSGTTSADFAGRVFSLNVTTGAMTPLGDDVFKTGHLPYALAWYQNKLWVGTNRGDTGAAVGKVYWIRPGVDTAWTLDHTMTGDQGSVVSLLPFQDALYVGLMAAATKAALLLIRASADGTYSTSDTHPGATLANNNSFSALGILNNTLYNAAINPGVHTYIRKLDGTWSTVSDTSGANCVAYVGLVTEDNYLFAVGAQALSTHTQLLRSANGMAWSDETAFLNGSPAPMGPAWGAITVT